MEIVKDEYLDRSRIFGLLQQFLLQLDGGVAIIDPNNEYKLVEVNDIFLKITGYSRDEIIGNNFLTFSGQENEQNSATLKVLIEEKQSFRTLQFQYRKSGAAFWHEIMGMPIHDEDNQLCYYLLFTEDNTHSFNINAIIRLEREIFTALEQGAELSDVLEQIANHVSNIYQKGCSCAFLIFNNPYLMDEMPGNLQHTIKKSVYTDASKQAIADKLISGETKQRIFENDLAVSDFWQGNLHLLKELDYQSFWGEVITDQDGEVIGQYRMYFKEKIQPGINDMRFINQISSIVSLAIKYYDQREEIYKLAYFDSKTGLRNLTSFMTKMNNRINNSNQGMIFIIQPGEYQQIVDLYGREGGDDLLKQLANRIKNRFIEYTSEIARYTSSAIIMATNGIYEFVSSLYAQTESITNEPFIINGKQVFITLKIGKTQYGQDNAFKEAIRQADTALSFALKGGGNVIKAYDPSLYALIEQEMEVLSYMMNGLKQREFQPMLQPKVNLVTGEVAGFEALARWVSSGLGVVSPAIFIPVAEKTGTVYKIDRQILRHVLQWQKERLVSGKTMYQVSVNISPSHFYYPKFVQNSIALLEEYGVDSKYICFEITESMELENIYRAKDIIQQLHTYGIVTSIDDFGIGYSSLSYLQQLPFTEIKIDKSFIDHIEEKRMNAVVKSIIQLADAVEMISVAEGIETQAQHEQLKAIGCQIGQGYYYYRPMKLEDIDTLLLEIDN